MEIVTYNAAELKAFVNSDEFDRLEVLPISRHRALSHVNNPRLDPEKNLLYVAYKGAKVVGYRLMLCDHIYLNDEPKPIGWYSCVWVDAEMRGQGIAKRMVSQVFDEWGTDIVYADPVPESENLYIRTGKFQGPILLNGIRLYVRATLEQVIMNKKPQWKWSRRLWSFTDELLNLLHDGKISEHRQRMDRWGHWTKLDGVDDEVAAFIKPFQKNELFRRGKDDLNWITQYPWIRQGTRLPEDDKYYFSSVEDRMKYIHVRVNDPRGIIIGYMLVEIRDDHLKVPYAYFKRDQTPRMASVLWQLTLDRRIETVTVFHPLLVMHFKRNRYPAIFAKTVTRNYYAANHLHQYFKTGDELNFMEGDGDQAFT